MFSKNAHVIQGKDVLLRYVPSPDGVAKAGIIVPKTSAVRATRRNQIKRILRAALRKHLALPGCERYAIVVVYKRKEGDKKGEHKPKNKDLAAQIADLFTAITSHK